MTETAQNLDLDRIRAREVAEAHFAFEVSNDADHIMKSMKSYDPLSTSVVVGEEGGVPRLVLCRSVEEQRAFYAASRAAGHVVDVQLFTSFGTDWYGFVHGIVTSRTLATGVEHHNELIGLLPVTPDEDTIAAEIGLGWLPSLAKDGDAPRALAHQRLASRRVHDAWLELLRGSDATAASALYAPDAAFAIRDPRHGDVVGRTGRTDIHAYYAELFAGVEVRRVDLVACLVDRWYVFSELLVGLRSPSAGDWSTRLADVCVIDASDRITVHLATTPGPFPGR